MIRFLDTFIDTRAKRFALFSCITAILMLLLLLSYIRLSLSLLQLENYQDLFALLETDVLQLTYISRVILSCLSMAQFDLMQFLKIACSSMRIWECLTILCLAVLLCDKKRKKLNYLILITSLFVLMILIVCAMQGFQASSVTQAISAIRRIGYTLLISSIMLVLMFSYLLCHSFYPKYREALAYEAIECN